MAIQTANLGVSPSGAGGDTFRTAATKFNENFTNNAHAASRLVGTQSGNVMEVGVFGVGGIGRRVSTDTALAFVKAYYGKSEFCGTDVAAGAGLPNYSAGFFSTVENTYAFITVGAFSGEVVALSGISPNENIQPLKTVMRTDRNTTVDANGFLKSASPIVKVFADKVDLNDEAGQQNISFEKMGAGDYLIKGSTGFAQEGWYVETPKDANGNVLFSVIYATLENGDISVKTYKKKFDLETASIVADLTQPIDITENRWIDIRLQALPPIEYEMPTSKTPADFQPTGIAQAVSEMMNGAEQ